MKKVLDVNELKEGMETSSAVLNKFGQILLGANSKIEERHFNILKTWGIKTIEVYYIDDENGIDEEMFHKIKEELVTRAGWSPRIGIEEDLFNMAVESIYESQLAEETEGQNGDN